MTTVATVAAPSDGEVEGEEHECKPKGKVLVKKRTRNDEQEEMYRIVSRYRAVQKMRVGNGNAFGAMVRGGLYAQEEADELAALYMEHQIADERRMVKHLRPYMRDMPIYRDFLSRVRGISEKLGYQLIGLIQPIGDFATVSKLWAYSGWHCDKDGKAARRKKGVQSNWNDKLKVVSFQAAECFMKAGGPYRELYDTYRERDVAKNGEPRKAVKGRLIQFTKMHYHKRALRYVAKMFLSHIWQAWRELEGLEVRGPYVIEHGGHSTLMSPWSFVEPEKKPKSKKKPSNP
jgi:hypothetical protein